MENQGILSVVSGFSGAGKGTIMRRLLEKYDNYALSVSATTRRPREGEVDGISYFFKTREEFEKMISENALYEYAEYQGNYYGTPKAYVQEQLAKGKDVILEIEVQGASLVREQNPDTVLIFVSAPNTMILKDRLTNRGTEDEAAILGRMKRAAEEAELMSNYDYILINDDLEAAVDKLHEILQVEHEKAFRKREFIENMQKELKSIY